MSDISRRFEQEKVVLSFCSSFVNAGSKTSTRCIVAEFVEMIDDDRIALKRTVTGDENWCFVYDPETKRQSATWLSPKKPKLRR
jgi:hypothetical protein